MPIRSTSRAARPLLCQSVVLLVAATASGQVPEYTEFSLEARSNIVDGFNLPPNSSFNSGTPAINDLRQVAIRLVVVGGTDQGGLFFGQAGIGEVVYTAPSGPLLGDARMNNLGQTVFELFDFGGSEGVFRYDPASGETELAVEPGGAFNSLFLGSPQIAEDGVIGFRGEDFQGDRSFLADDGGVQTRYATVVENDPSSPYSYLFTPSFNDAGQIAGKVRLGSSGQVGGDRPDEIRVFDADGSSLLIAVDRDGDPDSPFDGFDNGVSLANDGRVAFVANLVGGGRGVFLGDGSTIVEIATTADPEVSDVAFFHPAANAQGLVAFRGEDEQGLEAIFVGDGTSLVRVIGEHDPIETDLGTARVDQHDSTNVFGGSPAINENGDVAFTATLTPDGNNQIEWGTGLFVAVAEPTDLGAPANPLSLAIVRGSLVSGGLADVAESDDVALRVRSQLGFLLTEANVNEIEVGFDTDANDPTTLNLVLEARINNPNGQATARLRDWTDDAFVTVAAFPVGTTEATETVTGIDATGLVRASDGRLDLRLKHAVVATFSAIGFDSFHDLVRVNVQ